MSKPRIFISSTYYDLKHIRNNIESFIESIGYEPVLFESGDIPFHHELSLAQSCYRAIEDAHMLILIIGGRYGQEDNYEEKDKARKDKKEKMYKFYNSITKKEFELAKKRGIPKYVFIEKNVLAEYNTYNQNRHNYTINYAFVDSINIFKLIDEIKSLRKGNSIKAFDKFEEISGWLKEQWAGIFKDYLEFEKTNIEITNLSAKINELAATTDILQEYIEALMRKIKPDDYEEIINLSGEQRNEIYANRFINEPLINNLKTNPNYKLVDDPLTIYNNFEKSKSLLDFLRSCKLTNEKIEKFILKFPDSNEAYLKIKATWREK